MNQLTLDELCLYQAGTLLCRPMTLRIQQSDRLGIVGPNGCGKTTLLHTIMGLHTHYTGKVYINGNNIHTLTPRALALWCGLLFQTQENRFTQRVLEYCRQGRFPHPPSHPRNIEQLIHTALKHMSLEDKLHHCVTTLSGGEMRRLAIARLLVQEPIFYLLDEPTNHLDIKHIHQTMALLLNQTHEDRAMIMATHDINLVSRHCNKTLLFLPQGDWLFGETKHILTADHLKAAFQHSMTCLTHHNMVYWVPDDDFAQG